MLQIAVGIVAGVVLSLISPDAAKSSMLLGNLFVQALKAVAPGARPGTGSLCDRESSQEPHVS